MGSRTDRAAGTVRSPRLRDMDRFYLAVTVFALLLLLGVAGLDVTRTADIMPPGRSVPQDCSSKRGARRSCPIVICDNHGNRIKISRSSPVRAADQGSPIQRASSNGSLKSSSTLTVPGFRLRDNCRLRAPLTSAGKQRPLAPTGGRNCSAVSARVPSQPDAEKPAGP